MNLRNMLALTTVAVFCFAGVGISASDALAQQRQQVSYKTLAATTNTRINTR
jgi:hypothetical protein